MDELNNINEMIKQEKNTLEYKESRLNKRRMSYKTWKNSYIGAKIKNQEAKSVDKEMHINKRETSVKEREFDWRRKKLIKKNIKIQYNFTK